MGEEVQVREVYVHGYTAMQYTLLAHNECCSLTVCAYLVFFFQAKNTYIFAAVPDKPKLWLTKALADLKPLLTQIRHCTVATSMIKYTHT